MSPLYLCLLFCVLCKSSVNPHSRNLDFAIVGYVPEWRFASIDFTKIIPKLTHLILFSIEVDADANIVEISRLPSKDKVKKISDMSKAVNTKLLISFGGFGRSNGFPVIAKDKILIKKFCHNVLKFTHNYGFDGIDLNWEYPQTKQEWKGLFEIIQLFKSKFPNFVITVAFYPGQESILSSDDAINIYQLHKNIDLFLMMSYDNMKQGKPSKHSTFEFAVKTVSNVIKKSNLSNKLCLGLPFYGRNMISGDWKTYNDIIKELKDNNENIVDIKNMNVYNGYYYNGYNMIVKKTEYALKQNIGGIMIWENGQDYYDDNDLSLITAIYDTVQHQQQSDVKSTGDSIHKEL